MLNPGINQSRHEKRASIEALSLFADPAHQVWRAEILSRRFASARLDPIGSDRASTDVGAEAQERLIRQERDAG